MNNSTLIIIYLKEILKMTFKKLTLYLHVINKISDQIEITYHLAVDSSMVTFEQVESAIRPGFDADSLHS